MKKMFAALTIPGLLIGGTAVAGAQTADDTTDSTEESFAGERHKGRHGGWGRFAEALDLTRESLKAAIEEGKTLADIAGEQGVDIDAVIDEMVAEAQARADENPDSRFAERFDADEMRTRLTEFANNEIDLDARKGRRHRGPHFGGTISEALGLEQGELREALSGGQTIADVAADKGVDIAAVVDQIVADAEAKVAENPDSRFAQNFDAEQLDERLTALVNGEIEPGDREGRRGPGRGGPGRRGPAPDPSASGVNA